jgi:electron transfer flavoprotein beta subunit
VGADEAIRIDGEPTDGYCVANDLAMVVSNGNYDLIMLGKESSDYNGAMVPAMLAAKLNYDYINACIGFEFDGEFATISRETEKGKEVLTCKLPLVIAGQKGIVEEKDLKIPNMRGLMMAKRKSITVLASINSAEATEIISYENLSEKKPCTMIDAKNVKELAKIIYEESKS